MQNSGPFSLTCFTVLSTLPVSFDLVVFVALEFWVTGSRAVIGPSVLLEG